MGSDREIVEEFAREMGRRCAAAFWRTVESEKGSQATIAASQIGVRRGRIYEWRDGDMSLDDFYLILTAFGWDYSGAGRLPPLEERMMAGFHGAVKRALPGRYAKAGESLGFPEFIIISFMINDTRLWEIRDENRRPTLEEWGHALRRVAAKVTRQGLTLGPLRSLVTYQDYVKWRDVVFRVLTALPFPWLEFLQDD